MKVTGYTYSALKQCLHELANYIRESLAPDRLKGFDLQTILEADDYLNSDKYMDNAFA